MSLRTTILPRPIRKPWWALNGLLLALSLSAFDARQARAQDDDKGQSDKPTKRAKPSANNLDELLNQVKRGGIVKTPEASQREKEFRAAKDKQKQMLQEALEKEKSLMKRSSALEQKFQENELKAAELEETLRKRLGTTGELFGIVRQVAGDMRGQLASSLTSAQISGRKEVLDEITESKKLPSIDQLEKLWFIMQQEMTESGKVARFETEVIKGRGKTEMSEVVRVGVFNAVAGGKYLRWLPDVGKLAELGRQPESRYLETVDDLEEAEPGSTVRFAIDPSRGSILGLLVQTQTFFERLDHGGYIGYGTLILGGVTFFFGLLRLIYLLVMSTLVTGQRRDTARVKTHNPLGRVMAVFKQNRDLSVEDLERKLDEAVLRESSRIEGFTWAIKVVSVVAPLLGLLGTVTGMIATFQSIQLFGTGDPKMMAGGISEALVTTMIGLIVAVPLVLLHSVVRSTGRKIIDVLYEQSAGLVAAQAEKEQA